nr:hypothetical protein BaRGS_000595 [Batillaria attramentaria]
MVERWTLNARVVFLASTLCNFLYWFPIGVLGLLSSQGIPVSSEANVSMATIVLPFSSVLSSFLLNLNIVLERRRRTRGEKLLKGMCIENAG